MDTHISARPKNNDFLCLVVGPAASAPKLPVRMGEDPMV